MRKVTIIGAGRLGGSLAIALQRCGYALDRLVTRGGSLGAELESALSPPVPVTAFTDSSDIGSEVVLIAVQDGEIETVASAIADRLKPGTVVLHTSGSVSSDALAGVSAAGAAKGSLHPLISFSSPVLGADRLKGGFFCVEGDEVAVEIATEMVEALGGTPFSIASGQKSLYHAAAVMACGHVVSLLDIAFDLLSECGLSKEDARRALLPLVESSVRNLESQSASDALTGPIARADLGTVIRNMEAIEGVGNREALELYATLGERSADLAAEAGADSAEIMKIREALRLVKGRSQC